MGILTALGSIFGCTGENGYQSLNADEFEKALKDSNIICIDVRTSDEYSEGRIADAINIDIKNDDFENKAEKLLSKDKTIAVYCLGGVRSKVAASKLVKKGFKVIELDKGIKSWEKSGKAIDKEEMDIFTTDNGTTIKMYSIKHASIRMQIADKWVYFDPVTMGTQLEKDYSNMPKADYIIITHDHYDHLDTLTIGHLSKDSTVIITNPAGRQMLGKGETMVNGDTMTLPEGWIIDAVPAYNVSEDKLQFHPKDRDNGYVLTVDGFRIYVGGDMEDIPELSNIKNIDVAFLPCNLPYTMTPEQLAQAAEMLNPLVLFPYHYGETDTKAIEKALKGSGIDVRIRQYQ